MFFHRKTREQGQATTSIILIFSLIIISIGFLYTFRIARLGDQAITLQTAADAAALAGAQSIVDELPREILRVVLTGRPLSGTLGMSQASTFASRNDAQLVSYRYQPGSDRVEVTVRSRTRLESGSYEQASASAALGLRIQPCVAPRPTPSPSPPATPSPSPTPSPTPDPPAKLSIRCGDLQVPIVMPSTPSGLPALTISTSVFKRLFTVRLTS